MPSLFCLLASAFLLSAAPGGSLAYLEGTEQEDQCVMVLTPGGGAPLRVGPGMRDGAPRWSPDGSRLAFETQNDGRRVIWVVNADGTGGQALPHAHEWNQDPRWSQDGTQLAYTAQAEEGLPQRVMVYSFAREAEERWGGEAGVALRPVWMPNLNLMLALHPEGRDAALADTALTVLRDEALLSGALLAIGLFGGAGGYTTEPVIVSKSGMLPILPLAPDSGESRRYAEWHIEINPKGERLAFESNEGGDREVMVLGRRGFTNVSNDAGADWAPVWSPDGRSVAFESFRGGTRGVYRVFTDTARVLPVLAPKGAQAWAPAWSADGRKIACVTDQRGRREIAVVALRGDEVSFVPLEAGRVADAPAWSPVAKR